ncbi:MAG: hypothetical protein KGI50_05760 [Patescibacteria group bacterium]|nr:hypothetical protein [Patescibacteria group bacterium]MDE1971049.1 hypothetical protein [Patescibacteria group bacterium]
MRNQVDWSKNPDEVVSKLTVFNQRKIPACAAHSIVTMMQIQWYRHTGEIINFSPRFLDILSWTPDLDLYDGRDMGVVMDLATRVGCCTEDLLPNDTTLPIEVYRDRSIITKAMIKEANTYRLSNLGLRPQRLSGNRN